MVIKFFALILLIITIVLITLRRSSSKFNKKDVKVTNADEYAFNVKFHDFIFKIYKGKVDELKNHLIDAFKKGEEWVNLVKKNGCMDGYSYTLVRISNDLYIDAKYKNDKPIFMLRQSEFEGENTFVFNTLDEIVGFFTEIFEQINKLKQMNDILCQK